MMPQILKYKEHQVHTKFFEDTIESLPILICVQYPKNLTDVQVYTDETMEPLISFIEQVSKSDPTTLHKLKTRAGEIIKEWKNIKDQQKNEKQH